MISISNVACAAEPCSVMTTTISPNTINNKQRHYGLWLDMSPGHWTYSVVIFYKTNLPGPATGLPAGAVWDTAGVASHS